jgi:hypothetical protein
VKFTFDRPTEPGPYHVSLAPERRESPTTVHEANVKTDEKGRLYVDWYGQSLPWNIPFLDGAQWSPRETPADPFATADADKHAHDDATLVHSAFLRIRRGGQIAQEAALWVSVKDVFQSGATVSAMICRRFGGDPFRNVPGIIDAHGLCGTCGVMFCRDCEEFTHISEGSETRCGHCDKVRADSEEEG